MNKNLLISFSIKKRVGLITTFLLFLLTANHTLAFDWPKWFPFFKKQDFSEKEFQTAFNHFLYQHDRFPQDIVLREKSYRVALTTNDELENRIHNHLKRYRSDFVSVVLMDNNTGAILAALNRAPDDGDRFGRIATFRPTHPAASIFKIVTAADLLEQKRVSPETEFLFAGRATTLYRYQLRSDRPQRWARKIDFEDAFARSNNVIFGRAAVENLSPQGLKMMAEKFGFNQPLNPFIQQNPSLFPMAVDQYNLAELASGLNVETLMSPLHGALIASVIANDGILRKPHILRSVRDQAGAIVWEPKLESHVVVSQQTTGELKKLMMATIAGGTARKAFRRSPTWLSQLEIGGKTGSITGGEPFGKRDWFVAYAKDSTKPEDKGISICVMVVNKKRWYVKSTQLAREIFELIWSPSPASTMLRRNLWISRI